MSEVSFCPYCGLRLDPEPILSRLTKRVKGRRTCEVCFEMWTAICGRGWWLAAHAQWQKEVQHLRRLRPGGDYFANEA